MAILGAPPPRCAAPWLLLGGGEGGIVAWKNKPAGWCGSIYVLTNLVTGLQYVGLARDYSKRWAAHIAEALHGNSQFLIHRAIRKYGVERFSAEVIQHCRTAETLRRAERRWIKRLHSYAHDEVGGGYNLTLGGEGALGMRLSAEAKRKLSDAAKKQWASPLKRAALLKAIFAPDVLVRRSANLKFTWANVKLRDRLARKAKERWRRSGAREEYSAAMRESHKRNPWSEERRRARSEESRRQWVDNREVLLEATRASHADEAYRKRASETAKKRLNEDLRKTLSERTKALWKDPVYRAKRCAATKAAMNSAATKARCSAAAKVRCADPAYRAGLSRRAAERMRDPMRRESVANAVRALWKNPEYAAAQHARRSTAAFKARASANTSRMWLDESLRAKIIDGVRDNACSEEWRAGQREGALRSWARRKAHL